MIFLDIKSKLKNYLVFSIHDIKKIDENFHQQRLSEWEREGYIKKVKTGFYIFTDLELNEEINYLISNKIYSPSYISLQSAMSVYNLIPEAVYGFTAMTTNRSKKISTKVGYFIYKHIPERYFFGYELRKVDGHVYQIADLEKTLIDYLYFYPNIKDELDFEGLRLNVDELKPRLDLQKVKRYLEIVDNLELSKRMNRLIKYIDNN